MIDRDNLDFDNSNIIIVIGFVLLLGGVFYVIGSVGIPFIGDSPETLSANNAIDISETDKHVIIDLKDEDNRDKVEVVADNDTYKWDDNQVKLNKSELYDNIEINTYSGDNLYDTYAYNSQSESVRIDSDENAFIKGNEYQFEIDSQSDSQDEYESVIWTVNNDSVYRDTPVIEETFEENGTQTISVELTIDDVDFTAEKNITVVEPDDVVLEANVDKTNVTELEELSFNVTELSDQDVESYRWNLGDNNTKTGSEIGHWYQENGTYNVTVTGEASETEATGEDTISINVSELEEDIEKHQITVNTFDSEKNGRLNNTNITIDNSITDNSDEEAQSKFDVIEGSHIITADKDGYESDFVETNITNDTTIDMRLSPESNEDGEENEEEINNTENQTDNNEEEDVDFEQEEPNEDDSSEAPSRYERILDNMNGNGTTENPYVITTISEFQSIEEEPTASYVLGNDINAAQTQLWNFVDSIDNETLGEIDDKNYNTFYEPIVEDSEEIIIDDEIIAEKDYDINYSSGEIILSDELINNYNNHTVYINYEPDDVYNGFTPINSEYFAPEIDGDGHVISNLYINRPMDDNVGIFTEFEGGAIYDLTIGGHYIQGYDTVGGLIGDMNGGIVRDVTVSGQIYGNNNIGGISGKTASSEISDVNSLISINGNNNIGGISGQSYENSKITNTSVETPGEQNINGNKNIGGLIGDSVTTDINTSYSLSVIDGDENVGGLIGRQDEDSSINKTYAALTVSGGETEESRGGLIGLNNGQINDSYWDVVGTNQDIATGENSISIDNDEIIGLQTNQMTGTSPWEEMTLFDFQNNWDVTNNYPKIHTTLEEKELSENNGNLIISKIDDNNREETIEVGDNISTTPQYENQYESEITVNIIESGIEVHTFNIPAPSDETNEDTHIITPETDSHPNESSSQLDGYKIDEDNMEIDVVYTSLDFNDDPVIYDKYPFVVNIQNDDEDINPNVEINNKVQNGTFTKFDLIPEDYELSITADGYDDKNIPISMNDEPKEEDITLEESDKVDLGVNVTETSEVTINEQSKTGESVEFTNLTVGEYMIEITPSDENLNGSIKEKITISEDSELEYSFEDELVSVVTEDASTEEIIESNITIDGVERINSPNAYFGGLEAGTYEVSVESEGYESRVIEYDIIGDGSEQTLDISMTES